MRTRCIESLGMRFSPEKCRCGSRKLLGGHWKGGCMRTTQKKGKSVGAESAVSGETRRGGSAHIREKGGQAHDFGKWGAGGGCR